MLLGQLLRIEKVKATGFSPAALLLFVRDVMLSVSRFSRRVLFRVHCEIFHFVQNDTAKPKLSNCKSNHLHTTLDELAQCLTLEHAVTQEGKVDELVQHLVVLGEVSIDGFTLGALGINLGVEFSELILLG